MKKTAPASTGRESDKTNSGSESRETESKLNEEASSSSSCFSEEPQGFTSASEIYSVRSTTHWLHLVYKQLFWIVLAADYSDINMYLFFIIPSDEAKENRSRPEGLIQPLPDC